MAMGKHTARSNRVKEFLAQPGKFARWLNQRRHPYLSKCRNRKWLALSYDDSQAYDRAAPISENDEVHVSDRETPAAR